MLAAQYPTTGPDAGKLEVTDIPQPEPGPGEVLVRVRVSGVNPTDWKSRDRLDGSSPFDVVTPNQDGAGEIEATGDGVDPSRVGERVWTYHSQWQRQRGSAAQYLALPAEQAVKLPDGVSFDLGAGLGIPFITAHRLLYADGPVDGLQVLVHGGAGAVGHAAIELARFGGARVAATVSSEEKAELARAAGAELVVDYKTEDVAEAVKAWAPDGVGRVVDVDLAHNLAVDAQVVARGGTIGGYVETGEPVLPTGPLMAKNAIVRLVLVYTTPPEAQRAASDEITRALQAGALTSLPVHRFALEDIAAAHDAVREGAVGKVLVDVP
jgi:NADPH2:quinone reductase